MAHTSRGIWYPSTSDTVRPASRDFRDQAVTTNAAIAEAEANATLDKGAFPSGADLNDYTETAVWSIPHLARADTLVNFPRDRFPYLRDKCIVTVVNNGNGVYQRVRTLPVTALPHMEVERHRDDVGRWTDWHIVTLTVLPVTSGQDLNLLTSTATWTIPHLARADTLVNFPRDLWPELRDKAIIEVTAGADGTVFQEIRTLPLARINPVHVERHRDETGVWTDWRLAGTSAIDPDAGGGLGRVTVWGSSTPAGMVPELKDELRPYGVMVTDRARGGQWSSQTVANIGSQLFNLPVIGGVIPASGPVEIDSYGSLLDGVDLYLAAPSDQPLMGWLQGVYGQLVGYGEDFDQANRGVRFERAWTGDPVTITESATWMPEVKEPAHLNVLGMGKNDLNVGRTETHLQRVIARRDASVAHWQNLGQEFLILGHFVNRSTGADSTSRIRIEADNADAEAKYPDHFINMQQLLSGEELWDWTGITPTSEDRDEQAMGNLPPSIQGTGNHLNAEGDRYMSWKISQWMVERNLIGNGRIPFS